MKPIIIQLLKQILQNIKFYYVVVNNIGCVSKFISGAISIQPSPIITQNLNPLQTYSLCKNQIVTGNNILKIKAISNNSAITSYEWYKNSSNVVLRSGNTLDSLIPSTNNVDTNNYYTIITNNNGCKTMSQTTGAYIIRPLPEHLTLNTSTRSYCQNDNPNLTYSVTAGLSSYNWYYNNVNINKTNLTIIDAANTNNYTPKTDSAGQKYYTVVTSNIYGCMDTSEYGGLILVNASPKITTNLVKWYYYFNMFK